MTGVLPPAAECGSCGRVSFPPPKWCPNCFSKDALRPARLSHRGRLFEWTTVFSPAPGFEAPYRVGYVDLPEGVRLFGQIDGPVEADVSVGDLVDVIAPSENGRRSAQPLPYVFARAAAPADGPGSAGASFTSLRHDGDLRTVERPDGKARAGALDGAWISGVGMTQFGRFRGTRAEDLAQSAIVQALDDAGVGPEQVESIFVGHVFQGRVAGQRIGRDVGLDGRPLINVENACASGAAALHLAVEAVASGRYDVALAVGVEQLSVFGSGVIPPDLLDIEGAHGRTNPATYALMAKRHMAEFGTTGEQLASVVVQARSNGRLNERAQMREPTTVEAVLSSPPVATPLSRLQCCPTGDGAAAAVVVSDRFARRGTAQPVRVRASVICGGLRRAVDDRFVSHPVTRAAAAAAYAQAGFGPEDVDVAEVHDAFSIAALVHLEDLGFFEPGQAGPEIARGATAVDGRCPVNPSGGLLAKGHPLGATGLAQVFELVEQLRGRSGGRQVPAARTALAQCEGGVVYGLDAGVCAIHILEAA